MLGQQPNAKKTLFILGEIEKPAPPVPQKKNYTQPDVKASSTTKLSPFGSLESLRQASAARALFSTPPPFPVGTWTSVPSSAAKEISPRQSDQSSWGQVSLATPARIKKRDSFGFTGLEVVSPRDAQRDADPRAAGLAMTPGYFWSLPHADYLKDAACRMTSSINTSSTNLRGVEFDRLFIKRCKTSLQAT